MVRASRTAATLTEKQASVCQWKIAIFIVSLMAPVTAKMDTPSSTATVFWDDQLLAEALVTTEARQFSSLITKLNSGEPINVLAWGSSVVASHAGCGGNSLGKRFITKARGFPPACEHSPPTTWLGWGTRFMHWVNEEWPHDKVGSNMSVHKCLSAGIPDAQRHCSMPLSCT